MSARIEDAIDLPLDQIFLRFNAEYPELGGHKKATWGRDSVRLREEVQAKRKLMADIINTKLEQRGHGVRVDHRSLKEQGIQREPERHLGPGKVRSLSMEDKLKFLTIEKNKESESKAYFRKAESFLKLAMKIGMSEYTKNFDQAPLQLKFTVPVPQCCSCRSQQKQHGIC